MTRIVKDMGINDAAETEIEIRANFAVMSNPLNILEKAM